MGSVYFSIGKIARENVFHFPGAIRNPEGVSYF
jgi:hypothetical protein